MGKLDAHHERMMARMVSQPKKMEAVVDVFKEKLKKMDTTDLEANWEKLEDVTEHQEVPKEEAMVETIGELV
jgi:hypothetical protein